jgi:rubrerythrin
MIDVALPPCRGTAPGGAGMAEWSMEEALRMALRWEKENFEEYGNIAAETSNPGVKTMFLFLANEERNHMKLIQDMMRRLHVEP